MSYKKITLIFLIFSFLISLSSCDVEDGVQDDDIINDDPHIGVYVLDEKTVDSYDETDQYVFSTLEIKDNQAIFTELDIYGLHVQEGIYILSDASLVVTLGLRQLTFNFDEIEER